jgi:hypothetical protein
MIVVAIAFPKAPTDEHLAGVMAAAPSTVLCMSMPAGIPTPFIDGITINRINHVNVPWSVQGPARIRAQANDIMAPLANFAATFLTEEDRCLWLHDNIPGQPAFDKILDKSFLYPHVGFVSVQPRLREGFPEYVDYASRCVAWKPSSLVAYVGGGIPENAEFVGTTMNYYMLQMDSDGVPYIWTNIKCQENFTPITPPEI